MYEGKRIGAILLMGGEGTRFGSGTPKQFHCLGDKKVYRYTLDTLISLKIFDEILLVCHPEWIDLAEGAKVVKGGMTRQKSSFLGLQAFTQKPDIVLIHDAVRPFVSERILRENIDCAIAHGAADTCIPSADTLVYAPDRISIASIPKRSEYLRGQTPQTFQMDWILDAHEKAITDGLENASDDCQLVLRTGRTVRIVLGEEKNLKITSELDLLLAQHLLSQFSPSALF